MFMLFMVICLYLSISIILSEEWTIHVYTGTERFAGTDSNVYIRLYSSQMNYTEEFILTHENWIVGHDQLALKNLFESGEHDRFRILVDKVAMVEKIHVRRDHFALIKPDWFLDQIIVERNRDSKKFTFECYCWLRTEQPDVTIPVTSNLHLVEKTNSLTDNHLIIITLIISIAIASITCFIYCTRAYFHRRDFMLVEIPHEVSIPNRDYSLLIQPSAPPPPPVFTESIHPREDIRYPLPPRYGLVQSTDEPPSYKDLFPD